MFEVVQDILRAVTFIAVGGVVALVFFFVFAQTIIGSRTIHKQLQKLIEQNDQLERRLKELCLQLQKRQERQNDETQAG